jgi:uncharacterized protein DUF3800
MPNKFVFADEAGCFTFKKRQGASKYFTLSTVTTQSCELAHELLNIRRDVAICGSPDCDKLHATTDSQAIRDRVFKILQGHDFRIDATLLEKSKAQSQTKGTEPTFYQYAWYYHFRHVGPLVLQGADKLLITAAALGHNKTRAAFKHAVNNTLQQIAPRDKWEVSFMDSAKEPLLWAADYCAWAIQRKWERGDTRSYDLIKEKIKTEFDLWRHGTRHYY